MTIRRTGKTSYADYSHIESLPDPERVNDLEQFDWVLFFASALKAFFGEREDVLISGEGYLCHEAGGSTAGWLVPDCVVTFGVEARAITARNGYVINEVGKSPDFILEVGSRSTGRRDCVEKREGYAGYRVREYWRFDHTGGEYHGTALAGDLLVGDEYQPMEIFEEADGMKWGHSPVLGLDLCWVDGTLRVREPESGEFLVIPTEWRNRTDELESERDDERAGRMLAETERDGERAGRMLAETERDGERAGRMLAETERDGERVRRVAAEAEMERLREELRRAQERRE